MSSHPTEFDADFVSRLRAGDEAAFRRLVGELHGPLSRLARSFSRNDSVIEEAVQETWLAVIRGIHSYEGRAPLRSWVFAILVNHTRKLAVKAQKQFRLEQGRYGEDSPGRDEDGDDPLGGRFEADGHWRDLPAPWDLADPEATFLTAEAKAVVEQAIDAMPESQRRVVLLRDVEGMGSEEVCNILGITGTNERVLLHRGRVRVRQALDTYLRGGATAQPAPRRERSPE